MFFNLQIVTYIFAVVCIIILLFFYNYLYYSLFNLFIKCYP